MPLACKVNVRPRNLWIAAALARIPAPVPIVITAGIDGKHMVGSKHYDGDALDIRTKNFPSRAAKLAFAEALRRELGPAYQVIFEAAGTPNEHLHVEFDPT